MNLKERTYLWYIAILRIYLGYYMLQQGIRKFLRNFPQGDWIGRQIGDLANLDLYPWYKRFFVSYVVPHHELFGYLVMIGEITVGICLLAGLFTRMSALVGLFLVTNYYLAIGSVRGGAQLAQQQTYIVSLIVVLLSNAGRTLGVDGLIFGKGRGTK
jgi:thiosulfate dehydrogenase [quinone] large subunit